MFINSSSSLILVLMRTAAPELRTEFIVTLSHIFFSCLILGSSFYFPHLIGVLTFYALKSVKVVSIFNSY